MLNPFGHEKTGFSSSGPGPRIFTMVTIGLFTMVTIGGPIYRIMHLYDPPKTFKNHILIKIQYLWA